MDTYRKASSKGNGIAESLGGLIAEGKIAGDSRIFFFGANKSSLEMNGLLRSRGFVPEGFIDNSPKKQGTVVGGMPVSPPEDVLNVWDPNICVLIASEYHVEMCCQLERLGYKKDRQAFVVSAINDFYDTSKANMKKHAASAERGMTVYKRLMGGRPPRFLFLCPYPGTGDIFLIGGYLEKYMEKHGIADPLITVVSRAGEKILMMYGLQRKAEITVILQEDSNDLVNFMRVMGDTLPFLILNDNYLRTMHRRLRGYRGIDFHTMFKYAVFRMGEDDRIELPDMDALDMAGRDSVENFFKKEGLPLGKTAVLSPYANTISNLPMGIWEEIAGILKKKGYTVCTNSASDEEPTIKGTKPVFIPFPIAVPVLEKAGLFVAMRSGLCDIVASAQCKKIIFYPKGYIFGSCSTYDYFSLNFMGFCNDAVEIEFEAGEYIELLDKIMEEIAEKKP